jgi:DNA-binding LacI/PurR family transcriptional regulator
MRQHHLEPQVIEHADVLKRLYDSPRSGLETQRPDALICCTHEQLFEILDWENGNPLLAELALATFDSFPMSKYLKYPVHFVEIDLEMMGKQAAQMLFSRMNKEEGVPSFISIPTQIGK